MTKVFVGLEKDDDTQLFWCIFFRYHIILLLKVWISEFLDGESSKPSRVFAYRRKTRSREKIGISVKK
jgi:hypothetical protein